MDNLKLSKSNKLYSTIATLIGVLPIFSFLHYAVANVLTIARGDVWVFLGIMAIAVPSLVVAIVIVVLLWRYDSVMISPSAEFRRQIAEVCQADDTVPQIYGADKKKLVLAVISIVDGLAMLVVNILVAFDGAYGSVHLMHSVWLCDVFYEIIGALTVLNLMLWFRDRILRVE